VLLGDHSQQKASNSCLFEANLIFDGDNPHSSRIPHPSFSGSHPWNKDLKLFPFGLLIKPYMGGVQGGFLRISL